MTRFAAIKQGHIKIVDISIVCNFTVDKCELNPAYVIKNIDSPKDLLNGQKKRSSSENRISYSIKLADKNIRHDTLLFDLRVHFLHRNYFFGRIGIQRHRGGKAAVQGGVVMHFILQRTATDHAGVFNRTTT